MKIGKKTIVVILVATIGASVFIGLTVAAPPNTPKQVMILASYSGDYVSPTTTGDGSAIAVTSNKPATYTVTAHYILNDPGDYGYLRYYPITNIWAQTDFFGNPVVGIGGTSRTFTIAGYGVILAYHNEGLGGLEVLYSIVVQGSPDTTVILGTSSA